MAAENTARGLPKKAGNVMSNYDLAKTGASNMAHRPKATLITQENELNAMVNSMEGDGDSEKATWDLIGP